VGSGVDNRLNDKEFKISKGSVTRDASFFPKAKPRIACGKNNKNGGKIMMNDSVKLAQLWSELKGIKDQLDNEIIPVGGYLGIAYPELMIALEELSAKIQNHFDKFRLIAVNVNNQ
jgi:hypothetical protein